MKIFTKIQQTISKNKILKIVLVGIGTTAIVVAMPIILGSTTLAFKIVLGIILPSAIFIASALIIGFVYDILILSLISTVLTSIIWGISLLGNSCMCSCWGKYIGLNTDKLKTPAKVKEAVKLAGSYFLLCASISIFVHYNYTLLLSPKIEHFAAVMLFCSWIGSCIMPLQRYDHLGEELDTNRAKKLFVGAVNGLVLGLSQLCIGDYICNTIFEMGYLGNVIACGINIVVARNLLPLLFLAADKFYNSVAGDGIEHNSYCS